MIKQAALEQPCYKRNYLTQVIARVDFFSPLDSIAKRLPDSIITKVKKIFPIVESKKVISKEFQISTTDQKLIKHESMQWNFNGEDREKKLVITSDFAFIVYSKFESYQQLREEFDVICGILFNSFEELGSKRLGLRFINNIRLHEADPLDWNDYINKDMLSMIKFNEHQKYLNRLMTNIEYRFKENLLSYHFGIHNPDYPARIKQKLFVLDLDAYSNEYFSLQGIVPKLDILHDKIQEMFEYSITQKFREHLDA